MAKSISLRNDLIDYLDGLRDKIAEKTGQEDVSYSDAVDNLKNKGGIV